ncbi:MAG: glutathione-regulated potassium-efflux system protein KefB [Alphaproteobacteria bacterium]|nr:glutathione-regulated potassium-efflux system protein KefB [Alphaproteobacteria bacterium]
MLDTLVVLLAASVLFVPLSRRFGFGSVLGYLIAGAAIGPSALALVADVDQIARVSELGVIMLLFLIGLELRPQRLWVMRRAILGLGSAQLMLTGAAIALVARLYGADWPAAVVIGAGLALSSTAIVLPMLAEHDLLGSVAGRDSFSVLLFQDLAFIPLVAAAPLLAAGTMPNMVPWQEVLGAIAVAVAIGGGGRFVVGPIFRAIGGARTPEVFTAMALLIVVGTAALAHFAGLSTSLGAFLAGVLLSDSSYRHELQANIEPFEGLLLGFFFMSVGMSANLPLVLGEPALIAAGVAGLVVLKAAIVFALGRLAGQDNRTALRFALALPQGSEFSFVLFGVAVAAGTLGQAEADRVMLIVALSMAATPLVFAAAEKLIVPRLSRPTQPDYDRIESSGTPVIICGFGRMGQIVGRLLRLQGIPFTALDKDPAQVEVLRRFGTKVYFGDSTRLEMLRAAGAGEAKIMVIAVDKLDETLRLADIARRHFPHLKVLSRARNRRHAHLLMDRGLTAVVRETFHSSLKLSAIVLAELGVPEERIKRALDVFAEHDERTLKQAHAFYQDERKVIQSAQEAAAELTTLFEADRS